ncbi:MAG: hypothetical protein KF764_02695 [Labilithrix sp.]|nr:hypothetical protein [Labilithrix sp.]
MLRPGFGRGIYVLAAGSGALACWALLQWSRGMPFSDAARYMVFAVALGYVGWSFAVTRLVFEVDGSIVRGYRSRLGRRTTMFEHPLASVRDIGTTVSSDSGGDACFVTLVLENGERQRIEQRLFLIVFGLDEDFLTFRKWFLAQRYGGNVPEEIPSDAPSFE